MKITLVMIVRNEERSLERCLKSAEHLVDDIIIADTIELVIPHLLNPVATYILGVLSEYLPI